MKWLLALLVSVGMFLVGYHHASRYESDEQEDPPASGTEEEANSDPEG